MRYQNLIWDFDGTLFDTYPSMSTALQAALKWLGYDNVPYGEIYALFRRSHAEVMAFYADKYKIPLPELETRYKACAGLIQINRVLPFPYVAGLLARINTAGGKNFIFTHRGVSIMQYLETWHLTPFFSDVVSSGTHFARKPSPEGNLFIMKKHQLDPETTLAIGDREMDVIAAKNAGIAACLLTSGKAATMADYQILDFSKFDRLIGLPG